MKYSEIEKKLKAAGCCFVRNGTNHPIWYSPLTNRYFPLSHHGKQEAKPGTLKSIETASGVKLK